ncbi:NTTRR-F1 domain [Bacillus carboniphilus]|uniref:NTTRR-F1 domain n=1 Tax=Bacillus carboniphilus TaxID=86663 RepID=A0ABY9JXJ8_9BACI|nr:NTTRR-F1 domain [Bacillus carboniphilus]WLR43247.1 NTTRR-F1 domain [Bacillus carboniphilus]
MALFQNLTINGRFQSGELPPWTEVNACIVENPCPTVEGTYSAALKSGTQDASIEQLVNVIQDESYQLFISLAANQSGTSPFVSIILEFLDHTLTFIENGLELIIEEGQLPNGQRGSFKFITENTSTAPQNAAFARLKITKLGSVNTTAVIVDNVVLNRVNDSLGTNIPNTYVGNTGERTITEIPSIETIQLISGSPVAMVLVNDHIYVGNGRAISIIDTTDNRRSDLTLELSVQYAFNRNMLVNKSETKIYVCEGESTDTQGFVGVIDINTNIIQAEITVGIEPIALSLTSNDDTLYVLNQADSTVSVIDTNDNSFTASFIVTTIRTDATFLQVTPDDSKLIIGYQEANSFDVFNIPENTFNQSISFPNSGLQMRSIGISLDELSINVGCANSNGGSEFLAYEPTQLILKQSLQLSSGNTTNCPNTFVQVASTSTNTSCIYVGESGSNSVYQILENNQVVDPLSLITEINISDFESGFIGLSQDTNWIVTANSGNNSATFISLDSFSIFGTSPVGSSPQILVVT